MTTLEEIFDCVDDRGETNDYGMRVAALFAIATVSLIGGSLPWICRSTRLQSAFFFGTVFAGGVVLATGFVHILPDADNGLSNPCLGLSTTFPWAFVFCGASLLFTFMGEYFLRLFIRRQFGLSNDPLEAFSHNHDVTDLAELGGKLETEKVDTMTADNNVAAIMLEAGLIFHSIFIGLDIGINPDPEIVRPLMIALMLHQGFEGLALGTTFIKAGFSNFKYFVFLSIFVSITPIGIAIGIGVSKTYNSNGKLELGIEGGFNALSAGILVYNGVVDLLVPAFTTSRLLVGRTGLQLLAMLCMCTGFACMSVLAKWG